MRTRHVVSALVLLSALGCLGGCSDDDPVIPPGDTPGLPFPDTPDQLMQNFRTAYETMDLDELTRLMDPAFVTILQQSTTNEFPAVGPRLDVQEETRIHERMFSRQDVLDPQGSLVPGIQTIGFQTFARQHVWVESLANDAIPNTTSALYDVVILFDRGMGRASLKSQGAIKFYVTYRDSVAGGVSRPYYQMVGQADLTQSQFEKAEAVSAWGTVKALFR